MAVMLKLTQRTGSHERRVGASAVLIAGAGAIVVLGLTRRQLPEVVAAIGATFVIAWLFERSRRFVASGCILLGIGIALLELLLGEAPTSLTSSSVYRAFTDGWGYGILVAAAGCATLVGVLVSKQRGAAAPGLLE